MGNGKWEMGNLEMKKWENEDSNNTVLWHNWWVVKQESRVYMCKVAQVFARGVGLYILLFAYPSLMRKQTICRQSICTRSSYLIHAISSADYSCRIVWLSYKAVEHYLLYSSQCMHLQITLADMHSTCLICSELVCVSTEKLLRTCICHR